MVTLVSSLSISQGSKASYRGSFQGIEGCSMWKKSHFFLIIVQWQYINFFSTFRSIYRILLCDHRLLDWSGLKLTDLGQWSSRALKSWQRGTLKIVNLFPNTKNVLCDYSNPPVLLETLKKRTCFKYELLLVRYSGNRITKDVLKEESEVKHTIHRLVFWHSEITSRPIFLSWIKARRGLELLHVLKKMCTTLVAVNKIWFQ